MQQRNDTITLMKAVAIMCMVAGHSLTKTPLEWFVGLFHMPVFFFCSGYCFKEKYLSDSKAYVIRKIKTIWWPTFKWIVVLVLLQNILLNIGVIREEDTNGLLVHYYAFKDYVKYILMGVILHSHAPTFAGIWFLKMLLVATIFGFFIIKYCKNLWFYVSLGVLLLLSIVMLQLLPGHYPIVDQVHLPFLSTFFFLVGYDFKRKDYLKKISNDVRGVWTFLFCILMLVLGYNNWLSSMVFINAFYCVPYSVSAIGGVIAVYLLAKSIQKVTPPYCCRT